MTATQAHAPLAQLQELYDETELAILFDWLKIERPEAFRNIDLEATRQPASAELSPGPVCLVDSFDGYGDENAFANAVARLLLSEIQGRLPQWAAVHADGRIDLARSYTPKRRAKVELMPRFLFMINWADSGPGFSWPESYHVAYLPGFDRYVVTASQDSPEVHGYTDEAIGHFSADEAVEQGVHRVIVDWWRWQADNACQHRWAYLFDTGEVDTVTAESWADEVWDADSDEPLAGEC